MLTLTDLPPEIFTETLLNFLPPRDIESLSQVCRSLRDIALSEGFWRLKIKSDFLLDVNLIGHAISQQGWARNLWRGLRRPRVYVWGSADNGRLGVSSTHDIHGNSRHITRAMPYPLEISGEFKLPSRLGRGGAADCKRTGIVEMQAGGWSFAARDYFGGVWVWGQLEGTGWVARPHDYEHPYYKAQRPKRLRLPCKAESISLGRKHILVLDSDNLIWELREWGRCYHHTSPLVTASNGSPIKDVGPDRKITQICAGWGHSACLDSEGDVFAWHPFVRRFADGLTPPEQLDNSPVHDADGNAVYNPPLEENEIPMRWGKVAPDAVVKLPPIPGRLEGVATAEQDFGWSEMLREGVVKQPNKVIRIAAGDSFVMALRANGEVWMINCEEGSDYASNAWEFLVNFSSTEIRHITASFKNIVAYSQSSVITAILPGASERIPGFGQTMASDKPAGLQGRSVTSVKTGDYHSLALTTEGSCYSWGENAAGQLGLGDDIATWSVRESIHTDEPTLIRFGRGDEDTCLSKERDPVGDFLPSHSKRRFVFSIAAAGWHSGALVVDVEGGPRAVGEADATVSRLDDGAAGAANDGAPSDSNDIERSDQTSPRDGQSATTRFMPFIRFGHAAAGRGLGARAEPTQAPAEPAEPARHLPFIRIGYAGRGANRDGPGVQRHWRASTEAERDDHASRGAREP